ncbi:MAG: hypothetical protein RL226_291 [Bacteroidota bacterium]|jgi:hypothetical protein
MLLKQEESFDFEFLLFGIVCHEGIHRLCWFLNRHLNLDIAYHGGLEIKQKKSTRTHDLFRFQDEEMNVCYTLIDNRTEGGVLLPEHKQVDFFLKVEDDNMLDPEELRKKIVEIPSVLACFRTEVMELKHKENLLFD